MIPRLAISILYYLALHLDCSDDYNENHITEDDTKAFTKIYQFSPEDISSVVVIFSTQALGRHPVGGAHLNIGCKISKNNLQLSNLKFKI